MFFLYPEKWAEDSRPTSTIVNTSNSSYYVDEVLDIYSINELTLQEVGISDRGISVPLPSGGFLPEINLRSLSSLTSEHVALIQGVSGQGFNIQIFDFDTHELIETFTRDSFILDSLMFSDDAVLRGIIPKALSEESFEYSLIFSERENSTSPLNIHSVVVSHNLSTNESQVDWSNAKSLEVVPSSFNRIFEPNGSSGPILFSTYEGSSPNRIDRLHLWNPSLDASNALTTITEKTLNGVASPQIIENNLGTAVVWAENGDGYDSLRYVVIPTNNDPSFEYVFNVPKWNSFQLGKTDESFVLVSSHPDDDTIRFTLLSSDGHHQETFEIGSGILVTGIDDQSDLFANGRPDGVVLSEIYGSKLTPMGFDLTRILLEDHQYFDEQKNYFEYADRFGGSTINGTRLADTVWLNEGDDWFNTFFAVHQYRDTVHTGAGADRVDALNQDATIYLGTDGVWGNGFYARNVSHDDNAIGTQVLVSLGGKTKFEDVLMNPYQIYLSESADAYFLDDQYSSFHQSIDLNLNGNAARLWGNQLGSSEILALGGDDIIDLSSSTFSIMDSLIVRGGDGNDIIWTGAGAETLDGGDGNDTLNGSAGDDTLMGGTGFDIFEFTATSGNDTITDFVKDEDELHFYFREGEAEESAVASIENGVVTWDAVTVDLGDSSLAISDLNITYEMI